MPADSPPLSQLTGGCCCGFVRYTVRGVPRDESLCHCTICRRTTGAPVVAWFSVRPEEFAFDSGEPTSYRSSEHATRTFCPRCGAQLTFRSDRSPEDVAITTATLDSPESLPPRFHIWVRSQLSWLVLADGLPRHEEDPA